MGILKIFAPRMNPPKDPEEAKKFLPWVREGDDESTGFPLWRIPAKKKEGNFRGYSEPRAIPEVVDESVIDASLDKWVAYVKTKHNTHYAFECFVRGYIIAEQNAVRPKPPRKPKDPEKLKKDATMDIEAMKPKERKAFLEAQLRRLEAEDARADDQAYLEEPEDSE